MGLEAVNLCFCCFCIVLLCDVFWLVGLRSFVRLCVCVCVCVLCCFCFGFVWLSVFLCSGGVVLVIL